MKKWLGVFCLMTCMSSWAQNDTDSCFPSFALALTTAQDMTAAVNGVSLVVKDSNNRVDTVINRVDHLLNDTIPLLLVKVDSIQKQSKDIYDSLPGIAIGSMVAGGVLTTLASAFTLWSMRTCRDKWCRGFGK